MSVSVLQQWSDVVRVCHHDLILGCQLTLDTMLNVPCNLADQLMYSEAVSATDTR